MDSWWDQKEHLEMLKKEYERRHPTPVEGEPCTNVNALKLSDWDKRFLRSIKIAT